MKIDFEVEFFDNILRKGYDYYLTNKVSDVEINDNIVTAKVLGNDNYDVMVEIDNEEFIDGECSCSYLEDGEYCEHMAALLYYLNEFIENNNSNYDLKNIVDEISEVKLREFLLNNLMIDSNLLNRFRVEFNDFFPKLSKKDYEDKIYNAINSCYNGRGFIDYNNTDVYVHTMFEYIDEAKKLLDDNDYNTAFVIVSIILDSIPETAIDDSDGSTALIADSCIEILHDILDMVVDKNNIILKDILDYVIEDVKTLYLYNYGIDLSMLLNYYIDSDLYLNEIELSLEVALDNSSSVNYFYSRKDYIEYLIQIYELNKHDDKIMGLLEKYSFDERVCIMYVDELIRLNKIEDAIKVLKNKINDKDFRNRTYVEKILQIFLDNNMHDEYKETLYDMFFKYSKYDFDIYLKIKGLYTNDEWNIEKNKIIDTMMKDNYSHDSLNEIYIEEKMYDELFSSVCNYRMSFIEKYEKYLLPKYNEELLNIYMERCLNQAECAKNRKAYRDVAINVNHIIKMNDSNDIVKVLLKEISEKHFRSRPAMLDEFSDVIKNLNDYIK